jgi:hypothetical protein
VNEAYLKRKLVDTLRVTMPGAVVIRHEDKFTAGVPDLSVSWNGITSFVEVKYQRKGRKSVPTALQARMIKQLRENRAPAYVLTYLEAPRELVLHGVTGCVVAEGHDHRLVADTLRNIHLDLGGR